jgi:hypothetical protein
MQPEVIDPVLLPGVVSALKERQLRRVVFPLLYRGQFDGAKEYLKTELREWDRKGILIFEDVQGYFHRWQDEF